nr:Os01g0784833 [Ipomoea batatas]
MEAGTPEDSGGLSGESLSGPQRMCGIKESLHLSSHHPKPRRATKEETIRLQKLFRRDHRNIIGFRMTLHLLQNPFWKAKLNLPKCCFDAIHRIRPLLYLSCHGLHMPVQRVKHYIHVCSGHGAISISETRER